MPPISNEQIEKLLADVSSIKLAINRNRPLLQLMLLPKNYRTLAYLVSGAVFFLSLTAYALMAYYGDFSAIPGNIKNGYYLVIAVVWATLAFIKFYKLDKTLTKIDQNYNLNRIMLEFFSFRILHVYIPIMGTMIVLIIYFALHDAAYYIVPTVSISFGMLYNFIGSVSEIKQYLISGYWMLLAGLVAIVFTGVAIPIVLAGSLGIGWLLFALPMTED